MSVLKPGVITEDKIDKKIRKICDYPANYYLNRELGGGFVSLEAGSKN